MHKLLLETSETSEAGLSMFLSYLRVMVVCKLAKHVPPLIQGTTSALPSKDLKVRPALASRTAGASACTVMVTATLRTTQTKPNRAASISSI